MSRNEDLNLPSPAHNNNKIRRKGAPDHGENFVPGSESAPNLAPQPLDHFKRGYRERAHLRDRETTMLNGDFRRRPSENQPRRSSSGPTQDRGDLLEAGSPPPAPQGTQGGTAGGAGGRPSSSFHPEADRPPPPSHHHHQHHGDRGGGGGPREDRDRVGMRDDRGGGGHPRDRDRDDRGGGRRYSSGPYDRRGSGMDRGGGGDDQGRGQVIMGLDVQALVERLCRPGCDVFTELDATREEHLAIFQSGKAVTAIISNLARRRKVKIALSVWEWIDSVGIKKNTFHYNSMISVCEKVRDYTKALKLLDEMKAKNISKNEVTFSSAISACEKCGQWRTALDLLEQMKKEGAGQTAIAYNAAISACEKGLVPHKALEIFDQMKREGVKPTVVTYSALISAAEKGQQWKLALEVLEEMKAAGHGANVIAYSAAISALSKGQMWHKALELFREIEASGGKPSIVTYNATMTALEKGLQWERALDLFDEMKLKNMPVTVVSYGSAISACEKGLQYRQCLEFLDEMTEMGIKKNVIIFGAAMSCMEKSCRADIAFQLMDRMKLEDVAPNVHIYNSAISACARCNLWEKGYELFNEMEQVGVNRDVVTYNAVLDAVCSQVELGRRLFREGVERGFYARVSRLGTQWLELDLHFLSLGGGEIALGWWFEECLVPYLVNTDKLEAVQSISIVTGYGKTRARGARLNDDGMRLRVRAMLKYMNIQETPQPNKGRIHIDKAELITEVKKNNGKVNFDLEGYTRFKEEETTANKFPDVPQKVRARFRPARHGEGPPGTFIRDGIDNSPSNSQPDDGRRGEARRDSARVDGFNHARRDSRRSSYEGGDDRRVNPTRRGSDDLGYNERRGSQMERHPDRRSSFGDNQERRGSSYVENADRRGSYANNQDRRVSSYDGPHDRRGSYEDRRGTHEGNYERRGSYEGSYDRRPGYEAGGDRRGSYVDGLDRRGSTYDDGPDRRRTRDWEDRDGLDRRAPRELDAHGDARGDRASERDEYRRDDVAREPRRYEDRSQIAGRSSFQRREPSYHVDDRRYDDHARRNSRTEDGVRGAVGYDRDLVPVRASSNEEGIRGSRDFAGRDRQGGDRPWDRNGRGGDLGPDNHRNGDGRAPGGANSDAAALGTTAASAGAKKYAEGSAPQPGANIKLENGGGEGNGEDESRKRGFDEYQKQQPNRGYDIEPAFSKRRSM